MNLIYALVDPRTRQVRYVGLSSVGLTRPRQHWSAALLKKNVNPHKCNWLRSILAEGLEPEIEVLEEVATRTDLAEAEEFWISYLRFVGCNLLNVLNGGNNRIGWKPSEETKAKIGAANKGRKPSKTAIERSVATRTGKPLSEEHKAKVQEAAQRSRGPRPEETRRHLSRANGGRRFADQNGVVYETQWEAARKLDLLQGQISRVLQGRLRTTGGYTFTYVSES